MNTTAILAGLLTPALVLAGPTHTQTDWSAGPGTPGPVTAWQSAFASESAAAWRPIPGQFTLAATPRPNSVQHIINHDEDIPVRACVGDLDGDGVNDLIVADPLTDPFADVGDIRWYRWDGGQWVRNYVTEGGLHGAWHVDTADVDGDGDTDVIACAYYGSGAHHDPPPPDGLGRDGHFVWFENLAGDASDWEMHYVAHRYWGARYVEAGDADGDGDIDLVGASELTDGIWEEDGDVTWFENVDGGGLEWTAHQIETDFASGFVAHFGDIDGDGDLDIIGTDYQRIAWYENRNGDGSLWLRRFVTTDLIGAVSCDLGDIDGDGDLDVVAGAYNTSQLLWYDNTSGTGSTWFPRYVVNAPGTQGVHVRDVDGDSDLDVYITRGDDIYWIEHVSGDGVVWMPHLIAVGDSRMWVSPGDVNSDGKLDALVTDEGIYNNAPQFTWYDLTQFVSDGQLTSSILDGGSAPDWSDMTWDAVEPGGTLTVEVRAGSDSGNLGDFVTVPLSGSNLADLVDPAARYLQYRIVMTASGDGNAAPVLRDINVETDDTDVPGDIDGDGDVDQADLGDLLAAYGSCDGDANFNPDADFNGDGCVGQDDLGTLLGNYGFGT